MHTRIICLYITHNIYIYIISHKINAHVNNMQSLLRRTVRHGQLETDVFVSPVLFAGLQSVSPPGARWLPCCFCGSCARRVLHRGGGGWPARGGWPNVGSWGSLRFAGWFMPLLVEQKGIGIDGIIMSNTFDLLDGLKGPATLP